MRSKGAPAPDMAQGARVAHAGTVFATAPSPRPVDVVDETFIDAPPALLAAVFTAPVNVANVWPHVRVQMLTDRGAEGAIWIAQGQLNGELEVWIEPCWDGAIVHHYVRATAPRRARAVERAHVRRWKRFVTAVKDAVEPTRRAWTFDGGQSERPLLDEV